MENVVVVRSFWHSSDLGVNKFSYKSEDTGTKVMDVSLKDAV
jgi:hypothetical protein